MDCDKADATDAKPEMIIGSIGQNVLGADASWAFGSCRVPAKCRSSSPRRDKDAVSRALHNLTK
jgi:hypothetical protein